MVFFLMLAVHLTVRARRRPAAAPWSLAAYALAVVTKLTPILLLGLFLRRVRVRWWWVLPAVGAIAYGPFLGSLGRQLEAVVAFSREWVFNPGPWLFVKWLSGSLPGVDGPAVARVVSLAVTLALVVWTLRRDDGGPDRLVSGSFLVLGGFLLFSAAVMPWYLIWVLPFAALRAGTAAAGERRPEVAAWVVLTAASLLSYLIFIDQVEHRWWLWLEYSVFFAVLVWGLRRDRIAKFRLS